jgi:hypothetical protein
MSARSLEAMDLEQLEEERDHLLESIEDLDRERQQGELDEADYDKLRSDYTARAATVLRAIEQASAEKGDGRLADPASDHTSEASGPTSPEGAVQVGEAEAGLSRKRRRRRWRWSVAAAAGVVTAGAVIAAFAIAGAVGSGTGRASNPVPDSRSVARDLSAARLLSSKGDDGDALTIYDQILGVVPHQAEALAYRGWILRQAGVAAHDGRLLKAGRSSIEASVAADPTYPDARAFLGYIRFEDDHDVAAAVTQFRQFLADHPPAQMVALTRTVVAQAFAAAGQPVPTASSPGPY